MKRSEMLDILTSLLLESFNYDESHREYFIKNSRFILTGLEQAGMAPPFVCNGDICCKHEWEEE